MKAFLLVCLLAAVYAEPEAKSDPYYLYNGAYGYPYAYSPYSYGYSTYNYGAWPYGGYRLYKREAEAEAKPEADPYLYYNGLYNYGYSGYAPYTYGAYSYGYPYYGGAYSGYRLFKREAEAEAKPEADPQLLYSGLGYSYPLTTYANTYAAPVATYATAYTTPYVYGYAGPRYVANSAGVTHVVAKREAEADPQFFYRGYGYNWGYPSYYRGYSGYPYRYGSWYY